MNWYAQKMEKLEQIYKIAKRLVDIAEDSHFYCKSSFYTVLRELKNAVNNLE